MTVVKPSPQGGKENIKPTTGIDSDPPDEDVAVASTRVQISLDSSSFYGTPLPYGQILNVLKYTCMHDHSAIIVVTVSNQCAWELSISVGFRSKTSFKVHIKSFVK